MRTAPRSRPTGPLLAIAAVLLALWFGLTAPGQSPVVAPPSQTISDQVQLTDAPVVLEPPDGRPARGGRR